MGDLSLGIGPVLYSRVVAASHISKVEKADFVSFKRNNRGSAQVKSLGKTSSWPDPVVEENYNFLFGRIQPRPRFFRAKKQFVLVRYHANVEIATYDS
jgi:hypothetical protein